MAGTNCVLIMINDILQVPAVCIDCSGLGSFLVWDTSFFSSCFPVWPLLHPFVSPRFWWVHSVPRWRALGGAAVLGCISEVQAGLPNQNSMQSSFQSTHLDVTISTNRQQQGQLLSLGKQGEAFTSQAQKIWNTLTSEEDFSIATNAVF